MADPSILVSYFTNATFASWLADSTKVHHRSRMSKCEDNVIVVFVNLDTQSIVGVATLGGKMVEHHPLDVDAFSGADAVYNKFEAPIKHLHLLRNPLHFRDVKELCRIPEAYKGQTNISKGGTCSFAQIFFKPQEGVVSPDEAGAILGRFATLIRTLA